MSKKIVVVGAGLAGLTAAIYLRRSGFDVTLLEKHSIPGGMSTSWKRKGYMFEGGIHWMTGSSDKTEAYTMWKDVGALDESVPIILKDPFHTLDYGSTSLFIYRDIDRTVEHLSEVSPADRSILKRLAKDVKAASCMQMPVFDIKGLKTKNPNRPSLGFLFRMLPAMPVMLRLSKISCEDWGKKFKHEGIARLFAFMPQQSPASNLIFTLATLHMGDGGYPEGGSLPLTQRMAKTFSDLGGDLRYDAKVEKVMVEGGRATGVKLSDQTITSDAVIVTQETVAALDNLFEVPPSDSWLKEVYEFKHRSAVCTFISIGVNAILPDMMMYEWKLATPISYADRAEPYLNINSYPDYASDGCTAVTAYLGGDTYDYWKKAQDNGDYETYKQNLAEQVIRELCLKFPQCEGNVEVVDVATPLTYERYTGAYHGAWMTEMSVGDGMTQYPGKCESILNLYFAGHRLMPPGGMPSAVASGRMVAQYVCRDFDTEFV